MLLAAEGNFLTKLVCDNTDCLSFVITLLDILTVLYLSYCANFKVNKAVRIIGWTWAAVVITGTVAVVAIHTCMFTIVSALFTALMLMALFGVTFEDIGNKYEDKEPPMGPPPFVCPVLAMQQCPVHQQPVAKAEETPVKEEPKAEPVVEKEPEPVVEKEPEPVEEVAATVDEGLTLKESLALAQEVQAKAEINKQYVIDFLKEVYGREVHCNHRANITSTGLPLADTHYAKGGEKNKCFVYVYETEVATVLLLRLTDEAAAKFKKSVKGAFRKSAFPKSREEAIAWFSLIADDSFTEEDIQTILQVAYDLAK